MALKVEIENGAGPGGTQVPLFVGYAGVGTATSIAAWRIVKITYDANDNPTAVLYPQDAGTATDAFEFVWDNRGTYTYS